MSRDPWSDEGQGPGPERPVRSVRPMRPEQRTDLQDALDVVWRYKYSILVITLLTVAVALFVSSRQTPVHESRASVLVTPIDLGTGAVPEDPNLPTEAELLRSVLIADIVAETLELGSDPRSLLGDLSVDQPTDTEILEITYRDSDPDEARRLATGFAQAYLQYRRATAMAQIEKATQAIDVELDALQRRLTTIERELARLPDDAPGRGALQSEQAIVQNLILQAQLDRLDLPDDVTVGRIIQPASLPSSPVSPNHFVNGMFGLIAGLALGVGLAFLRDRMSGRLRSADEAEDYLGAPVLGAIPPVSEWRRRKKPFLVTRSSWRSPASEAYRILRTNILSAASTLGAKSIVVTSAYSGEGKSATVANLGVVLARAGKRVTLVSADLRRPRLHEFFRSGDSAAGLVDVLAGRAQLDQVIQMITLPSPAALDLSTVSLALLPSGHLPEDPAELLTSETMKRILSDLERSSDFVLIDVPPVLPVTDALVVASVAQCVLVVIGPKGDTRAAVTSARQQIDKVGARIIGGVLNGPDASAGRSYSY